MAPISAATPVPYLGYRRYGSTVGGRSVTMTLTFIPAADKKPAGCEGRYFYGRGNQGELYLGTPAEYRAPGPLVLVE
ncbi:hypothetical protein [Hymenobacter coccineus]|uniref:hypothetical protein n=1 Tax=Hymenobacter coccineus TaxID=1908235 RepID=UPI000F775361|nr:hypothetical protein [Hymenobacter coccineus]